MWKVSCPECGTEVSKKSREDARETVTQHNQQRHDGTEEAEVIGEEDPIPGYLDAAEDPHSMLFYVHRNNGVYRAMCTECERIKVVRSRAEARDLCDQHNGFAHDGDPVAGIPREDLEESKDRMIPISTDPTPGKKKGIDLLAEMHEELEIVTR